MQFVSELFLENSLVPSLTSAFIPIKTVQDALKASFMVTVPFLCITHTYFFLEWCKLLTRLLSYYRYGNMTFLGAYFETSIDLSVSEVAMPLIA